MEFLALFLPLLLIFASLAISIFAYKRRKARSGTKLPRGSLGWPFMGETLEFLYGKPEKFVGDRMQKYSPDIFKTKILGEQTAVICGPAGNKFLFANEQKLVTAWRPHSMQKLFRSYKAAAPAPIPNSHEADTKTKILRSPVFLKPEALMRYSGQMDLITQQHLQKYWVGQQEVKVYPLSKTFTLTLASRFFLGLDDPDRVAKLVSKFDDMTIGQHSIPVNFPGTAFYRASKAARVIRRELELIIREKKAAMSSGVQMQDILSHMIVVTDPTGRFMPEAEIADKIMGLLVAGYSAVATAITFLMKYVGQRSDIYEKILAEQSEIMASKKSGELLEWDDMQKMKYSWNVACEGMRLTAPLQGTFREAITDFTYAGFTIPKGWKIYWTVSTTNKNSEYFPDPEKFDPSRYEGNGPLPFTYVPFGGGPRLCPGKEYARLSILTFLHNVVKKFKWETVLPNEKIIGDMMPTPEQGLPIRLRLH
ncbi:hypothetical protein HHK36_023244 [Tetracentron sinense]|uniref:Cytochrome P450 n=1 Tax=Tetracentron sinense TaxID=13715 RepID=A0A834YKY3_TETSI|nr:hypothetical protein HHK36_023244 [Tetracentron sinense]